MATLEPNFLAKSFWWRALFLWCILNLLLFYQPMWWNVLVSHPVPWSVLRQYTPVEHSTAGDLENSPHGLKYRVLEPNLTSFPQPLLLFLHGSGQRGDDNTSQLIGLPSQLTEPEWRRRIPGFVLVPQCPSNSDWQREISSLIALVEQWRNDPRVDRRRIAVTGISMGGFGTWAIVAEKPDWFAAAVPICGGGNTADAAKLVNAPIWAVHGSADSVVPVEESRRMIEAIRNAGGQPKYTELQGIKHDSWTTTYRDPDGVIAWISNQNNTRLSDEIIRADSF